MSGPLILRAALAALLYTFLGVALYVMWLGLRQQDHAQDAAPPAAWLSTEGLQPPQRIALYPITAIGRADDNHIVLDDPFASSRHAIIVWREQRWWLEDLHSHNGTFLNEAQISEPTLLSAGDRIQIGQTTLRFEVGTAQLSIREPDGTPPVPLA